MSYLYVSDFPFKSFCKLAQHVDKSADHNKPHFDLFFTTISTSKKIVFKEHELKKALSARHIDVSSVVWTPIDNGKLANSDCEISCNCGKI